MNQKEEIKKYERKIEDLHAQVEQAARELSQIESFKQEAITERGKAKKETESLNVQISALKAELESLNNQVTAKQAMQQRRMASQNLKHSKTERNIKTLQSKLSQLTNQIGAKKALVKNLTTLEKKHSKALISHKKLLADSEKAKTELVKARKQTKQVLELSTKILRRARERDAQLQARENAISKAIKKAMFYANRINKWNQSKGLKPIDFQL